MENITDSISKLRGENRKVLLESITGNFLSLCLIRRKEKFTIDELIPLGKNSNLRSCQRIRKEVIKFLLAKGKIRIVKEIKKAIFYRNQILRSQDFGSYKILMRKNGFYQKENGQYKASVKPRINQGCFSYGNKSIVREQQPYFRTAYEIIA